MKGLETILRRVAAGLAVLQILVAGLVFAGWQFRVPVLKGEAFGTFVAPNTALCFLCCGVSVLLQRSRWRILRWLGVLVAIAVTAFAAAVVVEYFLNIDLGIDRVFFAHRLSDWNLPLPGRFASNTAVGFTFAGISSATLRKRQGLPLPEMFASGLLLICYLGLVGYVFAAPTLYGHVMAPHTAVLFGLLGAALLCAASRHVLLGMVLGPYAGAMAAQRIIFAIVFLIPLLALLELKAERTGLVSLEFGTALFVLVVVMFFTVLTLHTAAVLNETDRKRRETETALLKSEKLAAAGRMAASIAHEINNPLEAVANLVYLLKTDTLSEEMRREYLELADEQLNRVAAIARRTLGFYKDEGERSEMHLGEVLDAVLETYKAKLAQKHASVTKVYAEDDRIVARQGEISQVMANLISNAVDALPDHDGLLNVSVQAAEQFMVVDVTDNGHGIASDDLGRVFEPFFTTKKEFGTGLGLWVSKELVEKNRGTIEVISSTRAEDHGTTCRMTFPAAQARERVEAEVAGAEGSRAS